MSASSVIRFCRTPAFRSFFIERLPVVGIAAIVGTLLVPGTLPPAGMETSQFFWLAGALLLFSATLIPGLPGMLRAGFRWHAADLLVLVFFGFRFLSTYVAGNASVPNLWMPVLLFVLYADIRFYVRIGRQAALSWIAFLLLAIGLIEIVIGFRQLYGYDLSNHARFHITGTFHNPAPLGGYLAMVLGVALSQLRTQYPVVIRRFRLLGPRTLLTGRFWLFAAALPTVGGCLMLLPSTQSRIAWIAAIGAAAVALLSGSVRRRLFLWTVRHRTATVAGGLLLLAVIAAGGWGAYRMKASSADGRLLMWKITARIIADHPVTGTGGNAYAGIYGDYQARYFASGCGTPGEIAVAGSTGAAFNDYLQLTAELGLVGLLLFAVPLIAAFRGYAKRQLPDDTKIRRSVCRYDNGLSAALTALLLFALASYPFQLVSFLTLLTLLTACGISLCSGRRLGRCRPAVTGAIVVVVFSLQGIVLRHTLPMKARYEDWRKIQPVYRLEAFEAVEADYASLSPYLDGELQFVFEYANVLGKTGDFVRSNEWLRRGFRLSSDPMLYNLAGNNYKALGEWQAAEGAYRRAFDVIPSRIYPLYLLTELYAESGQTDKMQQTAGQVLEFQEKIPSQAVREIKRNVRLLLDEERKKTETEPE